MEMEVMDMAHPYRYAAVPTTAAATGNTSPIMRPPLHTAAMPGTRTNVQMSHAMCQSCGHWRVAVT
jgi:hypothetical protein